MPKRRYSNLELASLHNDPYNYLGTVPTFGKLRIASKDRLLVEKGGTDSDALDLYLNLFTDNQVYAQWDRQINEITSKDWFLEAGGESEEDQKALEYVENMIKNLSISNTDSSIEGLAIENNGFGFDGLTRGLGLSLILGFSVAEIIWKEDSDGLPTIGNIKIRDPRRFHYDVNEQGHIFLKLKTIKNYYNGIFVPAKKFMVHRYWAIPNDDPYGNGIGRFLYYPVQWKRELLTLWLSIIDKYSDPTVVGKYDEDISADEKAAFDEALSNIARDMVISMPSKFSVDFVSPNMTSVDLLSNLEKVCNTYISKVISGEANTGEQGSEGSTKQTVSNSIRVMKAKAFSDLISDTINSTLIKWVVQYRFPKAKPPKIWRNFRDVQEQIELLTKIKSLGYQATQDYIENLTGIPLVKPEKKKSFAA